MLDKAAEFLVANDLVISPRDVSESLLVGDREGQILFSLMRTCFVIMLQKLRQQISEVMFAEDEEVIEALVF